MELRDLIRETRDLGPGALARAGHPFLLEEGRLHHDTRRIDVRETRVVPEKDVAEHHDEVSEDLSHRRVYVIQRHDGRPGEVAIGRDPTGDVAIKLSSVSSKHAVISSPAKGQWLLQDAGSTNGTFLEGTRLGTDAVPLRSGALVRLGPELRLTFLDGEAMEHLLRQLDPVLRKKGSTAALPAYLDDESRKLPATARQPQAAGTAPSEFFEPPPADQLATAEILEPRSDERAPDPPLALACDPFPPVAIVRDKPVRVGRDPSNDLILPHPQVSRRHARFERRGATVVLVDEQSANGCWVAGRRVETAPLARGAEVTIGPYVVKLTGGPGPATP